MKALVKKQQAAKRKFNKFLMQQNKFEHATQGAYII
jgi:hypothetical protein